MAVLSHIQAARGFFGESNLRGMAHGQLVTGHRAGTILSVANKIHVRRTFLFFGWGSPLSISRSGIRAEMAFGRASLLCRFLHLQLGRYIIAFCLADSLSLSKKSDPINCSYYSLVRRSACNPLFCVSRYV